MGRSSCAGILHRYIRLPLCVSGAKGAANLQKDPMHTPCKRPTMYAHGTGRPNTGLLHRVVLYPNMLHQVGFVLQGSWTPLHADVLRSFSWSVNVAGAKRWLLLPPVHTHLLYDRFGRCMAPSFSLGPGSGTHRFCYWQTSLCLWCSFATESPGDLDIRSTQSWLGASCCMHHTAWSCPATAADMCADAEEQYPNLAEARRHVLEVLQGVGDAIFVPSGWHHTVENLEGVHRLGD
jgi:Cupin-like domain